jgi:hypothetical protein
VFFDSFPDYVEADLPMRYDVKVLYTDPAGKEYEERAALDLDVFVGAGGITLYGLHDIHNRLKDIAKRHPPVDGLRGPEDAQPPRSSTTPSRRNFFAFCKSCNRGSYRAASLVAA